ncbi:MAG: YkgJ family cysteine cluster protein [Planctomycetes bacterium]|nr:YkgJ family cysteine cluster protein [Planctomycetota bacterium]
MIVANCDGCGACCRNQPFPPFRRHDSDNLPEHIADELMASGKRGEAESCLWLDDATGRCKHYEYRPTLCREFELGGDVCLSVRDMYQIT